MARNDLPRIISHYRLDRMLGSGAMGAVYEATDRRDDTHVAVKILHSHLVDDDTFRQRFEREAHVGALLRSPYTVHLLDYGFADGDYFLAMQYVEGANLRELCAAGPLPPRRALNIIRQAARALEEAEARRVVHRDIKPENILVYGDDSVKVSDFGIARQAGGATLTAVGSFIGTLTYASPEQQLGTEDHRSDIYSLGATLYYTLAGKPPFTGSTIEMLRQHREAPPPLEPLTGLPQSVIDIVSRCLEKDPDERYQSASELASNLERALSALPDTDAEPTRLTETPTEVIAGTEKTEPPPAGSTDVTEAIAKPEEAATRAAPKPLTLSLTRRGGGGLFSGETTYSLSITNPGPERQIGLSSEIADECILSLPASATLAANGDTSVPVKVRARSRRWTGGRRDYPFSISAGGGGGGPPTSVNGSFSDSPMPLIPFGGGLLALGAVIALIGGMLLLGGGDDDEPEGTATPTPSPTASITAAATTTATAAPTATAVGTGPPPNSIAAGEWFFSYTVTDNTCSFGLGPGETVDISLFLEESAPDDGFISDGELVDIFNRDNSFIDTYVFSYPLFEFTAPLIGGDFVFHSLFFDGPNSGDAFTEEHYFEADGVTPCVITLEEL